MSRRRITAFALTAMALVAAPSVRGQDCRLGTQTGASLLIPYFEVDPSSPTGLTTLFSVTNESKDPTLVRVVLWTDWAIPTLGFDVYLQGFDLQTFNLRDLFNGVVPSTGADADLSAFGFCGQPEFSPYHSNPVLTADERAQLQAYHRGDPGPLESKCAGEDHGDDVLRGYVTVDVVDECSGIQDDSVFSPAWGGYFAEGGGGAGAIAVAENRLWGDFFLVDPAGNFAQGGEAISLWADPDRFSDDPTFTFYGRYNDYDGRDERVPLPTLWTTRFLQGGAFSGGTEVVVWRDTGSPDVSLVPCAGHPDWHPLQEGFVVARDETGDVSSRIEVGTESNLFPLATQRVPVSDFALPYEFGRLQLALADGPNLSNPRQAWVQTIMTASGLYSLVFDARALNEICDQAP